MNHFKFYIVLPLGIFLSILYLAYPTGVLAETYTEAVGIAQTNAQNPTSYWLPSNSPGGPIITIVGGGQASEDASYGIKYDATDTKVIGRTMTKQSYWISTSSTTKAPGQDYNIVGTIASASGAFVTVGNDMTNFLDTNKGNLTGADVTKLMERGLGISDTGIHDAVVEYAVGPATGGYINDNLIRPTKNVDMSNYNTDTPGNFKDGNPFLAKPANMLATTYTDFQTFFANYVTNAYNLSGNPFPFTQFGYTYFWGNGGQTLGQIQGMSEFVIMPNQSGGVPLGKPYGTVTVYGIYPTQSYIYTRNDGTNFSSAAGSEYGNGFASFDITGSCDTVWAGHRFQSKIKTDLVNNNKIKIESGGSVSGGQGILIWSLNYEVDNSGTITGSTSKKWDLAGTDNIAILFKGDTTVYSASVPVPTTGGNTVNNYGEISSSAAGTAIKIESGDTVINNYAGAKISGLTAIDSSASAGSVSITNRGTISGTVALAAATNAAFDIGDTALTVNSGQVSTLNLAANSATDFGSLTTTGTVVNAATNVGVTIGGYIPNSATFKVVDTGGAGITAVPGTISSSSPIFNFSGDKSTGDLILTATRAHSYNSFASNSNAAAAGAVLNSLASNNTATGDMRTVLGALDSLTSGSQINQALNSLTPNVDDSTPQVCYEAQNQFINTVLSHFDNVPSVQTAGDTGSAVVDDQRKAGMWAQGFDSYLHQDPRQLSNGYNANVWGASMGYDVPVIDNFICGLNAGYAWDNIRTKDSGARTTADNYEGGIYGSYARDAYYIDGFISFAYNRYDSSRHIAFGSIDRTPKANYGGQQYSSYLETGYTFKNKNVTLTPLGSIQYMRLHVNNYTEEDAGDIDLNAASQDYDMFQTGLGVKLAYKIKNKDYTLIPDIHMKWLYDFIGDNQQATSTFTGGGASFGTNGFSPAQSSYDFGTRLIILSRYSITLSLNYDFELKEDFYSHSGYADIRYDF